ncbi:MAG: membrane protein required for colicin V production CvpA [Roseibaca calidilacus]|uniref:Membrane protein required for colicin V production n=1 Tax=Roseibaca calidilacus TaxID=1666912 RepID=A0A0P7VU07_9RHOB|nr:CvpA family protein [Roseibaca calidilacus]KPP90493.1 MAG: membrane protein required for colicin V production CvpA [Roseibaca calidilacus]CUX83305.1 membrane protein required for colicin V production [Roseibaca calidilacus]
MDAFTLVDAGVAVIIIVSGILAYSRGFVRETLAIVGWIVAAILAFMLAPAAQPLISEIPYLGNFLGDSCELTVIAAFAAVFALSLVLTSLFTPLFSSFIRNSALGGIDQGMGFFFGVLRGILLVAVALLVFDRAVPPGSVEMVENSRSAAVFSQLSGNLNNAVPTDAPNWLVARYEQLTASCR